MKKAAVYSPYLDTFGGGERYMITIAQILSQDFSVDVLLDKHLEALGNDYLKKELSKRFNLNLDKVNFIQGEIGKGSSFFEKLFFLKKYDLLFYLTDGSIFFPTAKKNILHIQSPLVGQPSKNWWGRLKLNGWDLIIYNSFFTQAYSQKNWPLKSKVIYPPVDTGIIKPLKKKKFILSVGRFSGYLKDKKHMLLIQVFKELYKDDRIKDWSLHLAGAAGKGDKIYIDELKESASGVPVNFYPNLSYANLIKLYGQAMIYWHASGYGENDPTKMEHFGISTVEAMAGGCIPVVIGKGGQSEIVENKKSGFLWQTKEQFKQFTKKVINNQSLVGQMQSNALERAKMFDRRIFSAKIKELVK